MNEVLLERRKWWWCSLQAKLFRGQTSANRFSHKSSEQSCKDTEIKTPTSVINITVIIQVIGTTIQVSAFRTLTNQHTPHPPYWYQIIPGVRSPESFIWLSWETGCNQFHFGRSQIWVLGKVFQAWFWIQWNKFCRQPFHACKRDQPVHLPNKPCRHWEYDVTFVQNAPRRVPQNAAFARNQRGR